VLYCKLYNLVWTSFRSQDFGLKLNWEAPMGDRTWCILSVSEWNADKTRVDKVRYWTASHACSVESICAGRSGGGWIYGGSGHGSHNILTLDALQVLSRSQVTWVVNVHADTADM
jgi:hypothetical protein